METDDNLSVERSFYRQNTLNDDLITLALVFSSPSLDDYDITLILGQLAGQGLDPEEASLSNPSSSLESLHELEMFYDDASPPASIAFLWTAKGEELRRGNQGSAWTSPSALQIHLI